MITYNVQSRIECFYYISSQWLLIGRNIFNYLLQIIGLSRYAGSHSLDKLNCFIYLFLNRYEELMPCFILTFPHMFFSFLFKGFQFFLNSQRIFNYPFLHLFQTVPFSFPGKSFRALITLMA